MNLTEQVKAKARELGADLAGIAPVERFSGAPLRMSPKGLLPEAACVVVAGIHHLDASVELGGQPTPHDLSSYTNQWVMNNKLDVISFQIARMLEAGGHRAIPIAASNIWRYHAYKDCDVDFAPDLAHRYAAVAAGLGEIGWSGLAMSPEFGPRNRFVSVVTDAELEPSPMYDGEPLCDKCMKCVETCPTDAFRKEVARINEIEIGGKVFKFPETNKWRCAWAENFGLDLAHDLPEKTDEPTILSYLEKYGMRGGEEGCCLQFCMNPQRRYYDESHCRPPRRKKEPTETDPEKLIAAVQEILDEADIDVVAVGRGEDFDAAEQVHPESHLPDAVSIISIGMRIPPECGSSPDFAAAARRRLNYAAFDVAHYLDVAGYSAISQSRICDELVAEKLGIYGTDMECPAHHVEFATVLTSARLPSLNRTRKKPPKLSGPKRIRGFCRESGADLVGFFTVDRFAEFHEALKKTDLPLKEPEVVEDSGLYYGPYVPRIRVESTRVIEPEGWLSGAKSVIVLGMHFPDAALDNAKVTPSETVGPFAFVRYEAQRLLDYAALKVVRALDDSGHHATFTHDLTGLASAVHSSRGMLPDMRANRFAAVLSGLAFIGINGVPITSQFGTRQVFIAIVTDAVLPDAPLYSGQIACETCDKPCISACPTDALGDRSVALELEGKTFDIPRIDGFACAWATRYCLAGEDGPTYCGLDVDVPVPKERTARAIAAAVSAVNWGVQKRHTNIVEECIRVCPAKGQRARPAAK